MTPTDAILHFWFEELDPARWFQGDASLDPVIRERFGPLVDAALDGGLGSLEDTPNEVLALILVLDQFPRHLFRGTPRAYGGDERARAVARRARERGFDQGLPPERRLFLYLPYQHSEDPADQQASVGLFRALSDQHPDGLRWLGWAEHHRAVIDRFGRFPERNKALGRESTPEEQRYLAEPEHPRP